MNSDHFAILMAGGVGSRFWPVSTTKNPKQFRDLLGSGESLLQTTFKRLSVLIPANNIFILTNSGYSELVRKQLPELGDEQVIFEPVMRNTAPPVLLASLKIRKRNKEAVIIMAPTDHWIENEKAFYADVQAAFETCRKASKIITFGVKPTFPNTGYGYIEFQQEDSGKIKKVKKFTEKPSFEKAKEFLAKGNYVWNAGIFVWHVQTIIDSFEKHLPDMFKLFSPGENLLNTSEENEYILKSFAEAEDLSIDYGILEKEDKVFMIEATFDWNDLGTWGSLYNVSKKDETKNAILNARVLAENGTGNIISSVSNKVVIVDGLSDYIIIDEEEVLLIVPMEKEQEIKNIRGKVQRKFGEELG